MRSFCVSLGLRQTCRAGAAGLPTATRRGMSSFLPEGPAADDEATGTLHALYFSLPVLWGTREQELFMKRVGKLLMLYEGFYEASPSPSLDGLQAWPEAQAEVKEDNIIPAHMMMRGRRHRGRGRRALLPTLGVIDKRCEAAAAKLRTTSTASSVVEAEGEPFHDDDADGDPIGSSDWAAEAEQNLYACPGTALQRQRPAAVANAVNVLAALDASQDSVSPFVSLPPVHSMSRFDVEGLRVDGLRPTCKLRSDDWATLTTTLKEVVAARRLGSLRSSKRDLVRWLRVLLRHDTANLSMCAVSAGLSLEGISSPGTYAGDMSGIAVANAVLAFALTGARSAREVISVVKVAYPLGLSVPTDVLGSKLSYLGDAESQAIFLSLPFLEAEMGGRLSRRAAGKALAIHHQIAHTCIRQVDLPRLVANDIIHLLRNTNVKSITWAVSRWTPQQRQQLLDYLPHLIFQLAPGTSDKNRKAPRLFGVYLHVAATQLPLPVGQDPVLAKLERILPTPFLWQEIKVVCLAAWSHRLLADLLTSKLCDASNVVLATRQINSDPVRRSLITGDLLVALMEKKFQWSAEGAALVADLRRQHPQLLSPEQAALFDGRSAAGRQRESSERDGDRPQRSAAAPRTSKLQRVKTKTD